MLKISRVFGLVKIDRSLESVNSHSTRTAADICSGLGCKPWTRKGMERHIPPLRSVNGDLKSFFSTCFQDQFRSRRSQMCVQVYLSRNSP